MADDHLARLSRRAYKAVEYAGGLDEIASWPGWLPDLLRLPNCGRKSTNEITAALLDAGLIEWDDKWLQGYSAQERIHIEALRSRPILSDDERGLGGDPNKFDRNRDVIARVKAGEKRKDVARDIGVRPERVTQIVQKHDRVQAAIARSKAV